MKRLNRYGLNTVTSPLRWIIVTGVVFFVCAGKLDVWNVWVYLALYAAGGIGGSIYVMKKSPDILNERGRVKTGTKKWDVWLVAAYFILAIIVTPIVAGLDTRYSWSLMPPFTFYIGILLYMVSLYFSFVPMLYNPFFETTVRIQSEREHHVIDKGPCAFIRHPGYIGMAIGALALCFALGSGVAFISGFAMVACVLIRTYLEDSTLKKELPGYIEYSKKVKYRLIPYIW